MSRFRNQKSVWVLLIVLGVLCANVWAAPTIIMQTGAVRNIVETPVTPIAIDLMSGSGLYDATIRVVDLYGQQDYVKVFPGVSGSSWSKTVQVPLNKYGSYNVTLELRPAGQTTIETSQTMRLVRPNPVPATTRAQRESSYIGSNTHAGANWPMLARIGVHWARDYSWQSLGDGSTAPIGEGRNYLNVWNDALNAGITILPCIQHVFWNSSETAYVTTNVAASFERYSNALPDIEYWEIDNESDYTFIYNKRVPVASYLTNYRQYIKEARAGLAAAGNNTKLVLNGMAGIQFHTINYVLDPANNLINDYDVINYHHYNCGVWPNYIPAMPELAKVGQGAIDDGYLSLNETVISMMSRANDAAHAGGKEAWLTEFGYAELYDGGVGALNQARYLARNYLLGRMVNTDKMFWYWDRDTGGTNWIATMGLFDGQNKARASAAALATLSKFTAFGQKLTSGQLQGAGTHFVLFLNADGSQVMSAWTQGATVNLGSMPSPMAYDLFGNRIETDTIGPSVVYFYFPPSGTNTEPYVDAGMMQDIALPDNTVNLSGTAFDDGAPNGTLTTTWTKTSGPGSVVFGNASALDTTAAFSEAGTYVLRLTASDGDLSTYDEVVINVEAEATAVALDYTASDLGNGLTGYAFKIRNNDGQSQSYALTVAFEAMDTATIRQMKAFGAVRVDREEDATNYSAMPAASYVKAEDTWVFSPFSNNGIPGVSPIDGTTFSGFVEGPNNAYYMLSAGSGSGSTLGDNVPAVYVVCDGNVSWTGAVARAGTSYAVSGVTETVVVVIPGDYNGDGVVDLADYTVWADNYGQTGSNVPGDGNNDGVVDLADYTVWADHYGQGTPLAMTADDENAPTGAVIYGKAVSGGASQGDFNGDGFVDQADYTLWADGDASADANGDGVVDLADYTIWADNL